MPALPGLRICFVSGLLLFALAPGAIAFQGSAAPSASSQEQAAISSSRPATGGVVAAFKPWPWPNPRILAPLSGSGSRSMKPGGPQAIPGPGPRPEPGLSARQPGEVPPGRRLREGGRAREGPGRVAGSRGQLVHQPPGAGTPTSTGSAATPRSSRWRTRSPGREAVRGPSEFPQIRFLGGRLACAADRRAPGPGGRLEPCGAHPQRLREHLRELGAGSGRGGEELQHPR